MLPLLWPGLGPDGGPVGPVLLTRPPSRPAPCDHDPDQPWAHSWAADGTRACWRPEGIGTPVAIDLERSDAALPAAVSERLARLADDVVPGAATDVERWCGLEVLVKLTDDGLVGLQRLLRGRGPTTPVRLALITRDGWTLALGRTP